MTSDKLLYELKIIQQQNSKLLVNIASLLQNISEEVADLKKQVKRGSKQDIKESVVRTKVLKQQLLNESKKVD